MTDAPGEQARPRYGEFATPEEQRARIRASDPTGSLQQRPDPAFAPAATPGSAAGAPAIDPLPAAAPRRLADRIVTFALLGYGAINVLFTVTSLMDFPSLARAYFDLMGITEPFTNVTQGRTWGTIAAVVLVVGYLVTLWLSWRRVRAGKLAWWIPLVGAVVTQLTAGVCMVVPIMGDPAVAAFLAGSVG